MRLLSDLERAASTYHRTHVAAVLQHGQTRGKSQDSVQKTQHYRLTCADNHQGQQPAGHYFTAEGQGSLFNCNIHSTCNFDPSWTFWFRKGVLLFEWF